MDLLRSGLAEATAAGMQRAAGGAGAGRGAAAAAATLAAAPAVRRAPPATRVVRAATHLPARAQRSMLQQMSSSSSSAFTGEVATQVRPFEARFDDSALAEETRHLLPQTKARRNYSCSKCNFHTRNSRDYLVHGREVHFERLKIYDCPHCVYASKHQQKLIRHLKVHKAQVSQLPVKMDPELAPAEESGETMEDFLEEIEECDDDDDVQMQLEDYIEESVDCDMESDRTVVDEASSSGSKKKHKFFSCNKCNYVTHIKGRYTKHVKYHSMPMIKCTICDFRTPYKWNLDRHYKNHGGSGSFPCSMCNFTADIKQSLTVHEMNHHSPAAGQSYAGRRRNRVGASDVPPALPEPACQEEGSSSASEMGLQYADKEVVSCNSDSNDASASDGAAKIDDTLLAQDPQSRQSPNVAPDESKSQKQNRKTPRPPPPLIPLNTPSPNQSKSSGEPPTKKFKEANADHNSVTSTKKFDNLPVDISLIPVNNVNVPNTKETAVRKKNESFFDKLKERLLTETGEEGSLVCKNCGFESKCLSEHSVHEKNCTSVSNRTAPNTLISSLGSTRCQNCRHRCKSSADLVMHLKTCGKQEKPDHPPEEHNTRSNESIEPSKAIETEPHPMENVVFVWNNIDQDANKFGMPLDININDDSTLPGPHRGLDIEIADDNESMNLSPSQAAGKKVFKCPHCPFWASTASRFHVHIVGHLNKKPFECSLCKYKSNWRWDITKHIKLKSARDPEHNDAKVLMTDETGRRNYSKYNKFLAMPVVNENGENEFHYVDPNTAVDASMEMDESFNDANDSGVHSGLEMQPLNLQTYQMDLNNGNRNEDLKKPKKTLWKCKKCNYRDPSKEALLEHVREHSRTDGGFEDHKAKKPEATPDPVDLAYRCGHCNQLSNWKHVIQRHCRLKHEGIIKVITTVKPKPDEMNENNSDVCTKCPFRSADRKTMLAHMQQHQPSPLSIFKCYFCPFFVKDDQELVQHLVLHGVTDPEDYIAKAMGGKSPLHDTGASSKRHKCTDCPYETNSKSQYMYHEQFHRLPADTPYKCPECNYSVSKRHLLHQHLRVHGIFTKKNDLDDLDIKQEQIACKPEYPPFLDEILFVWVSAKNEFHKMYKCRYCSYVNSQKCNIPYHEKIHFIDFENSELRAYKCLECKFTCDNAGRLAEHSKSHGGIYGKIYCPVEDDVPDEEQIAKLRKVIEIDKQNALEESSKEEMVPESKKIKLLYFCQKCPARFFTFSELKMHDKFHDLLFPNKCNSCEFSAPQDTELKAHVLVHTDEYHTKTKMLSFLHNSHPAHKQPLLELVQCPETAEVTWVASNPSKNLDDLIKISEGKQKHYCCKECPAKFFKSSALTQHIILHGGEGEHKCKKCSYAVKNIGNLAKHEILHETEGKSCDFDSGDDIDYKNVPLSGTDLFQRKTEAQKRVLTDKDKLVKPNDHFPPVLQADPQFGYLMHGNPEFIYPTYLKNGRQKEKRYKCHKCPSAFEKREQYKIHLSLHGSKQRYKCELCDYSVKYYANYVQHMRKHQMNDEAQAERKKGCTDSVESESREYKQDDDCENIKLAIKTMPKLVPKSDFQQFSITDQQTLRLLQRRRSLNPEKDANASETSPTKDRRLHICLLCPYSNQRLDALLNHYRRHDKYDILTSGNHNCSHCDLKVLQSHFLRDHLKTHFNYPKALKPECYTANRDVTFTISKVDSDNDCTDLKLDLKCENKQSNEEKLIVNIITGEIVVE